MNKLSYADYSIPEYMWEGLDNYFFKRLRPGGFLSAVLSNDLQRTVQSADFVNSQIISNYVMLLTNEVPRHMWGSTENFEAWLNGDN